MNTLERMMWRLRHPGTTRLLVNAAVVTMLIIIAALGYRVSHRQELMATEARQAQRLAEAAQQVRYRSADLNGWQTAYALDVYRGLADSVADTAVSRAKFIDAMVRFDTDLSTLESLPAPGEIVQAVRAVRAAFDEFMALDEQIMRFYRTGSAADRRAGSELVLGREIELYGLIAEGCELAAALAVSAADAGFSRLESVGVATRRHIVALSVVAFVLAVIGAALAEARHRAIVRQSRQVQRMASLGQLAGGVAHDLNNILSIILNYTAFVAEAVTDEVREDLAHIRTAADRAAGLTAQLLAFVRHDTPRRELLDVNAAIAETRDLLARTIGEHIELIAVPSPDPVLIHADAGQIQQILVNLAVNARDAMPDGGTLVIAATAADVGKDGGDQRPAVKPGRYVKILVSDTGTGIPPEVVARIFEPFYTTKPKGRGTGLGLATVHEIVTAAGGAIDVCSTPNIGTTFRVHLPAADTPDDAARPDTDTVEAPVGHGQSILIVEDEPALGASIARILSTRGYRTRYAVSGQEAINMYAHDGCDLLIADLVMPEMSGPRLAEIIHRSDSGLPVLYMSGYTEGALTPARGLQSGTDLIEKPFSQNRLLTAVDRALSGVTAGRAVTPKD